MDKLRLRFSKTGRAVYISHLDLMHTMQRAFSRAGYELKYSEGFNPHPQISIALPLSVGAASECEIMDFRLKSEAELGDMAEKLTAVMPEGIIVHEVYEQTRKSAEIKWLKIEGVFEYDRRDAAEMCKGLSDFYAQSEIVISKKHLSREREMCYKSELSPDCRKQCSACGAAKLLKGVKCDG